MNISNKYYIKPHKDNLFNVYEKGGSLMPAFTGTIEEVNAWISLTEKGFNI